MDFWQQEIVREIARDRIKIQRKFLIVNSEDFRGGQKKLREKFTGRSRG